MNVAVGWSVVWRAFAFVLFIIGLVLALIGAEFKIELAILFAGLACWVLSTLRV